MGMWGGSQKLWGENRIKEIEGREADVGIEGRRWERHQRSFNISSEIYLSTLWQSEPSGLNEPTSDSIVEAEHLRCLVLVI